jgi:hypothetical protein
MECAQAVRTHCRGVVAEETNHRHCRPLLRVRPERPSRRAAKEPDELPPAARNNVPAVYGQSFSVRDGGLLSFGPDSVDLFHRAASYVDRILRGAKPGDLAVQIPTKFEMVVNRKTAKALGLAIPPSILLGADEVIE